MALLMSIPEELVIECIFVPYLSLTDLGRLGACSKALHALALRNWSRVRDVCEDDATLNGASVRGRAISSVGLRRECSLPCLGATTPTLTATRKQRYLPYSAWTPESAARAGHWDVYAMKLRDGCHVTDPYKVAAAAARDGRVEVLRCLYEGRRKGMSLGRELVNTAASAGHTACVALLSEMGEPATVAAMDLAASHGHVDTVQWLHAHRSEGCSSLAIDGAARSGHLSIVQWLTAHVPTVAATKAAMNFAAGNNHMDVLVWLHTHRREGCTRTAMDEAAKRGFLGVVQWLHKNRTEGCSHLAMDLACANGHLPVVLWLHYNRSEGCTTDAMDFAAERGHLAIVEWLHEHRSEGCTERAMDAAARNGHLEVVKWLHENRMEGCTTAAMDMAAAMGHLDVVEWLHKHRREGCTTNALDAAAAAGLLDVVMWLCDNRNEGCTQRALRGAVAAGADVVAKYLIEHARVAPPTVTRVPTPTRSGTTQGRPFPHAPVRTPPRPQEDDGAPEVLAIVNNHVIDGDVVDLARCHGHDALAEWLLRVAREHPVPR